MKRYTLVQKRKKFRLTKRFPGMIASAVGVLFFLSSCSGSDDHTRVDLRVMSYNIAAGYGDLGRIAEVIEEQDPDLVALQEVDVHWSERSHYEDQAARLAEILGMELFFGEIYNLPADRNAGGASMEDPAENGEQEQRRQSGTGPAGDEAPARRYGLAILSKLPFVEAQNHTLSRLSTVEEGAEPQRMPGFPEVVVEMNGQSIRFFNTHLDYRSDPAVRQMQVEEMLAIIGLDGPALLLGDLNARPHSPELFPLFSVFRDSWQEMEDSGFTFPSDNPDRRIDYILHTNHFDVRNVFVVDTGASDHLPVVADLKLP